LHLLGADVLSETGPSSTTDGTVHVTYVLLTGSLQCRLPWLILGLALASFWSVDCRR